jgi:ATP-dependent protease ClpP protease subunit
MKTNAAKTDTFRFRARLPRNGEGKRPHAEVATRTEGAVARIHLYDVIDSWGGYWGISAEEFVEALDTIDDGVTELRIHINSPGGEVYEAIAIANALRNHPARVVAVVDGLAASAASYIAATADELVMGDDTELMIHDPWAVAVGDAAGFREFASHLDRIGNNLATAYARKAGGTTEEWRAVMIDEQWYSAQETVDAGLADRVGSIETEGDTATIEQDETDEDDELVAAALIAAGAKATSRAEAEQPPVPAAAADSADERSVRLAERRSKRLAQRDKR